MARHVELEGSAIKPYLFCSPDFLLPVVQRNTGWDEGGRVGITLVPEGAAAEVGDIPWVRTRPRREIPFLRAFVFRVSNVIKR